MKIWLAVVLMATTLSGCATTSEPNEVASAGTIFHNGAIWTAVADRPWVDAVGVLDNLIVATGSLNAVQEALPGATMTDLNGRMLLPGFHDSHTHFTRTMLSTDPADGDPFEPWPPGWDPVMGTVNQQIVGAGHIATYADHHANRLAVEPVPPLSVHEAGAHRDHMNDLGSGFPDWDPFNEAQQEAIDLAQAHAARYGITSHVEAGAPLSTIDDLMQLDQSGRLTARYNVYIFPEDLEVAIAQGRVTGDGTANAQLLGMKIYGDGWLGPRTAAMSQLYGDRPHRGFIFYTQSEMDTLVERATQFGLKTTAHTIGDRAAEQMVSAYERTVNTPCLVQSPACERRPTLEHVQVVPPPLLERLHAVGVVPSIQLSFATSDAPWAGQALGETRIGSAYPWRTMVEMGMTVAGSSDFPIEVLPPLWGIERMVTRADLDDGPAFMPEQAVDLDDALRMITVNAAYLEHREHELGTIVPGMLADLVVLDRNLFDIPANTIADAQVSMTMVDGHVVYAA